ncbi:MAG: GumC family protein, partial [Xenococcaceae cyanobacterium]
MESQSSSLIGITQYWVIIKRRWLPATAVFLLFFLMGVLATSMKQQMYEAEGKLKFKKLNTTSSLTEVGKEIGSLDKLAEKTNPLTTEAEIIISLPVIKETLAKLQLKNERGELLKPKEFVKQLSVSDVKGTDILKINYKHSNSKVSADVVNTLMDVYQHKNIEINREEAVSARKFVEKQLPKAEARTRQAEVMVREFKEKNGIVALDRESTDIVEQINELQQKIDEYKSQIADGKSQSQLIANKLGIDPDKATLIVYLSQAPELQEIVKKLQTTEASLAVDRASLTEVNPAIFKLQKEKETLKEVLSQRIQNILGAKYRQLSENFQVGELQQRLTSQLIAIEAQNTGLKQQIIELTKGLNYYRQRARTIPKLAQKLQELERKQDIAQSSYSMLLKQLQEIRVVENQNIGNVRVVSSAVIPEEAIASRQSAYLASAIFATLAAFGTAYLLEITDKSIKTVEEARKIFGYTWLGIIPSLTKPKKFFEREELNDNSVPQLIVRDTPASPISESYRM